MLADERAGEVGAHVAELRHEHEEQHVEMPRHMPVEPRREIDDLRYETERPRHVEQSEKCERHRLQRHEFLDAQKHLPRENHEHEEQQRADFKIVEPVRSPVLPRQPVEAPAKHQHAAEHAEHFEIRQPLHIEHRVVLPQPDEPEPRDEQHEARFRARENRPQRNRPKHRRARKAAEKSELPVCHGHRQRRNVAGTRTRVERGLATRAAEPVASPFT